MIGAPEPPSHATVAGWQVHYPFDGDLNELLPSYTSFSPPPTPLQMHEQPDSSGGLTTFSCSVAGLQQVWALVRHTVNAAALDLNTDSNTRQRDLCALDAWLATRYQAGVAPATSCHLRRRVTQSLFDANGYVNYWTEFLVAHVGALLEYTSEYDATESMNGEYDSFNLARKLWNQQPVRMGEHLELGMANYSLSTYFHESDSMVHDTPKPLVDWPRSSGIDTDGHAASLCKELCVQMNSYAVLTQEWMAGITDRVGVINGCDKSISKAYAARSSAIRAAAHATFATSGSNCSMDGPTPTPPPAPLPPPSATATCVKEWEADSAHHHHGSDGIATLNCGPNQTITSVAFADFGTPSGSCAAGFEVNSSCHDARARAVVESACLHKRWCRLEASREVFGDTCNGVTKYLAATVRCASSSSSSSHRDTDLTCYTDTPAHPAATDPELPSGSTPYTSLTATALAALARLPGRAAGVLELVPFLMARNSRRGAAHGHEGSGWMMGFMMEGLLSAAVSSIDRSRINLYRANRRMPAA